MHEYSGNSPTVESNRKLAAFAFLPSPSRLMSCCDAAPLAAAVDHSSARDCATKRTVFPRSYTALRQRNARLCAPDERLLFMHPLGTPLPALRNRLSAMRRSVAGVFPLGIAVRMTIAL